MSSPVPQPTKSSTSSLMASNRKQTVKCGLLWAKRRNNSGSILPLVAFLMALVVAFIALTADIMRTVYAGMKLQAGVESAALAAYSRSTDKTGAFSNSAMLDKLAEAGTNWNKAPAGPNQGSTIFETPISYADTDYSLETNPNDPGESFFRLKARRDGLDSIKLMFVPAIFAFNSLSGLPTPTNTDLANTYRITEVIGQPASRVGAGVPAGSVGSAQDLELSGFATFPLAISNAQFLTASKATSSGAIYTIDLASIVSPPPTPTALGHIRGAFVNLIPTGSTNPAYGPALGNNAIDELLHLFDYFQLTPGVNAMPPGVVERGSLVNAFDHEEASFKGREQEIKDKLATIPKSSYQIIPVLKNDPVIGGNNEVAGFARMRFTNYLNASDGKLLIQMQIGDSIVLRNASATNYLASVPTIDGTLLPAPVEPFDARNINLDGTGIKARAKGIVLAASLSANQLEKIQPPVESP